MTIETTTPQASLLKWREIIGRVVSYGQSVEVRGMYTMEIENFQANMPSYPFMSFAHRKLDIDYIRREFQWYLHGDKRDMRIADHATLWQKHINPDGTLQSNYGAYLFREFGFHQACTELIKDVRSRRAVISILNTHEHCFEGAKDIPCTYSISFRIRSTGVSTPDVLNMTVRMRSNDIWFGLGNDAPIFSWLHTMMWLALRPHYPDLQLGNYVHCADSMHVYARHVYNARQIAEGSSSFVMLDVPKILNHEEVFDLISGRRDGGEFSDWLYEVEL